MGSAGAGRERSCVERVEHALAEIERRADLGAFWSLDAERALERARALDGRLARGERCGPLAGRAVAWKDCFDVAGLPTTGGAPWRAGAGPAAANAAAVARFERAGAIGLGKLAMHQLAWGMMGQTPGRPPCRNPHAPERIPGGSSSGSAVAVAVRLVDHAPGTDAGGSVRQPASLCGVVGFKPGFATVPLDGCMPYTPSFDTAGPLAGSVADAALAFAVLADREPAELSAPRESPRVALLDGYFAEGVADDVAAAVRAAAQALGAEPLDLGWDGTLNRAMNAVYTAEPGAYVLQHDPGLALPGYLPETRADADDARRLLALDYLGAQRSLAEARRRCARRVEGLDAVLCATSPIAAVPLDGPDRTVELNALTKPFNGLRWPAISLPCGRDAAGLPIGLQLAAPPGRDDELLRVAAHVERLLA